MTQPPGWGMLPSLLGWLGVLSMSVAGPASISLLTCQLAVWQLPSSSLGALPSSCEQLQRVCFPGAHGESNWSLKAKEPSGISWVDHCVCLCMLAQLFHHPCASNPRGLWFWPAKALLWGDHEKALAGPLWGPSWCILREMITTFTLSLFLAIWVLWGHSGRLAPGRRGSLAESPHQPRQSHGSTTHSPRSTYYLPTFFPSSLPSLCFMGSGWHHSLLSSPARAHSLPTFPRGHFPAVCLSRSRLGV